MGIGIRERRRGLALLVWLNLKHYCWAIWGLNLRLDPDYPAEARYRGELIVDSVLEYRLYGLFALWCPILALLLPWYLDLTLVVWWTVQSHWRAAFYRTAFAFWRRAFLESPGKVRSMIHYAEELMREIERRYKANDDQTAAEMIAECRQLQDEICMLKIH